MRKEKKVREFTGERNPKEKVKLRKGKSENIKVLSNKDEHHFGPEAPFSARK
jgi:hypothetical protein